jgi:hypothetical protein
MMAIETTIYTRLSSFTGLTDLVATRIYPNKKPQDCAMPSVDYRRVTANRFSAMSIDSGVVKARFQFDAWGLTYASASAVRDQILAALQRYKSAPIQDCYILNETDLYEDDTGQHHIAIDIEINYSE